MEPFTVGDTGFPTPTLAGPLLPLLFPHVVGFPHNLCIVMPSSSQTRIFSSRSPYLRVPSSRFFDIASSLAP